MIINNFVIPLFFTVLVEELTAFVMGYRNRQSMLVVLLINVITNPVLNYIIVFFSIFNFRSIYLIILLEAVVIIVEWKALRYSMKADSKKMLILALAMNITSYAFGLIFYR